MKISIAIPASLVTDVPHLREKTSRLGMVGRALAMFRVREVIIYRDKPREDQRRDVEFIATILSYMEAPQYLRKLLFPTLPALKYAGILPPLRTLHHPITKRIVDLNDGEYREGVIVKTGKPVLVDIGVEYPIPLNERTTSLEKRITVKIHKNKDRIHVQKVEIPMAIYWGYRVNATKDPLSQILWKGGFDFVVLTSKYGESFTEVINDFRKRLNDSSRVLVAFGSAKQGIKEILENNGVTMRDISAMIVNTIPEQGTETIRTEEAIYATLAILNIMNK